MAVLKPGLARRVVTWGAAGKLVEPPGMLEAFYNLIDNPIPPLKDFSGYMKEMYGEANARVMVQNGSKAMRALIDEGGDISASRAAEIACPVLLIAGEHDFLATPSLVSDLAKDIRSGEFVMASDAGHNVHATRPEWLAETITSWLAGVQADTVR